MQLITYTTATTARVIVLGIGLTMAACPVVDENTGSSSSGSSSSEGSTSAPETTGTFPMTSSAATVTTEDTEMASGEAVSGIADTGGSTTLVPEDNCPPGVDDLQLLGVALIPPTEWPWESMDVFVEYALCEAGVPFEDGRGYHTLPLLCSKPEVGPETYDLSLQTPLPELAAEFPGLSGVSDLRVSFAGAEPLGPFGGIRHVTVRSPDDELILLASGHPFAVPGAELPTVEDPSWPAPFSQFFLQPQGCISRESLRPGSDLEEPLAIEFDTDEGTAVVFDREIESCVVGGSDFDVFVFDAFRREEIVGCDHCGEAEASFLVLRRSP